MACYFISDTHIGGTYKESESRLLTLLDSIADDAESIFLLGDIFDFWFEYKRVVPKVGVRLLGKLAELTDKGVDIRFFVGNHDMWMRDYLTRECGVKVYFKGETVELYGRQIFVAHGDDVYHNDIKVRILSGIFRSRTAHRLFSALIHPDCAMKFGNWWSSKSRLKHVTPHQFRAEGEGCTMLAREKLKSKNIDIFVFGHLHSPINYPLSENSSLYVLGGWMENDDTAYGVLTPEGFELRKF